MFQPSLRRLVSGLAVVATASALVATPVYAQSADQSAATSLSIRLAKARIEPGQTARITGHLAVVGDTAAGRTVLLEAKPVGTTEFVPVAEVVSAERGSVSTVVEPEVTTRYRWHFLGDADTRPSRSGVAALRVGAKSHVKKRLGTSLSIRTVFRKSAVGGLDIVKGRLRAGRVSLAHRPVILLARAQGSTDWTYDGVKNTRRKGAVKFVVDPAVHTSYRLVFLGSKWLRPARSAVVRVPHRPDVAITASPTEIVRGETVTITGLVTDSGMPVAGATVVLWKTKAGHPASARRVVERGVSAEDGSVVFAQTPRFSTNYRLQVLPAEGNGPALSGIARVVVVPASA